MLNIQKRVKRALAITLTTAISFTALAGLQVKSASAATNVYQERFQTMYSKIHDPANGYFSPEGIPYHSVETFIDEAPDYGHETTSEAFSYYMWLEAMNGKFSGDFSGFKKSWETTEKYIIPSTADQPAMAKYNANDPATYAGEYELPSSYPAQLDNNAAVGVDPIDSELKSAYGTSDVYGMHWILDVDNFYKFGQRADGTSRAAYINTFQRGVQESTYETVPQPCWDAKKFGGKNGYLDLFTGDASYAEQYKYTNAPDADARAVQATYYASKWAKDYGVDLSATVGKAAKMGDYLRYSLYDKYFRKAGNSTQAGTGKDSSMNLFSWYYAWGGDASAQKGWAWKIGSSHVHFGYQSPMAAWILSTDPAFKPKSATAATDWGKSLTTQLDFYSWLQSSEGAIAGGASNSNNGRYEAWPAGTSTFNGLGYQENPVYADPGSNTWFGMQVWSMQRVAQYFYETKDVKAKAVLDKWVKWANSEVKLTADGGFQVPSTIDWNGQPDTWTGATTGNPNLHVEVVNYSKDLGTASSLANALSYYAAANLNSTIPEDKALAELSKKNAQGLLDAVWKCSDAKGVSVTEARGDYARMFNDGPYIPANWTGTMPNGDVIKSGVKFIDIRSAYKADPDYARVKAAVDAGVAPEFNYHRFWAQSEFAVANGTYASLFDTVEPDPIKGDLNKDQKVNVIDYIQMKKFIAGTGTVVIDQVAADMNEDGKINIIDYIQLKKLLTSVV